MAAGNLDAAGLIAAVDNGLINEDVMQSILDISDFPLVLTGMIGTDSHKNPYTEWPNDALAAAVTDNKFVDGADLTGNDIVVGTREGNQSQISVKEVQVSHRADAADTIARAKETTYQLSRRTQELRRDIEASMCANLPSIADDGASVEGQSASLEAWLVTNTFNGALGSDGGYGGTTAEIVDVAVGGTPRALSETLVRDAAQAAYEAGGNPDMLMARPIVIRLFSEFCFDSTARVGIQQTQTGKSEEPSKAVGSVNVFTSDFGSVLKFAPNRLQPTTATTTSSMMLIDPSGLKLSFMKGIHAFQLAKTGLSEHWAAEADWTLKVLNEAQHAIIRAIDETTPVVA